MKLTLQRKPSTNRCTIGELFVDGHFQCHTLEDVVRDVKIPGQTAIPAGAYRVLITHSPRFKRFLPHLQDVPGFSGIRIHPGNTDADTEGCILPGQWDGSEGVRDSAKAFGTLIVQLNEAVKRGESMTIEVKNAV